LTEPETRRPIPTDTGAQQHHVGSTDHAIQNNHNPAGQLGLLLFFASSDPVRHRIPFPSRAAGIPSTHATMAFRVSPSVALLVVFSLMAVAHCVPLKAAELTTTTTASSAAEVDAVSEGEGLPLPLPYSEESLVSDAVSGDEEVPREEEEVVVEPVAEPDPDRSHPGSDGEEELTAKEQIDDDDDEEKKTRKNHGGDKEEKKKRKKRHDCDGKDKKEKKTKTKRPQSSNDEEEEEEEKMKKKIHRHHHVERKKTKKLTPHHDKIDDSDDEDEQEKKEKRWRKAISRSMFGHGRRSQREEAAKDEVNN